MDTVVIHKGICIIQSPAFNIHLLQFPDLSCASLRPQKRRLWGCPRAPPSWDASHTGCWISPPPSRRAGSSSGFRPRQLLHYEGARGGGLLAWRLETNQIINSKNLQQLVKSNGNISIFIYLLKLANASIDR